MSTKAPLKIIVSFFFLNLRWNLEFLFLAFLKFSFSNCNSISWFHEIWESLSDDDNEGNDDDHDDHHDIERGAIIVTNSVDSPIGEELSKAHRLYNKRTKKNLNRHTYQLN